MRLLIFPVAFMANTFAMMIVMIGLSLFGKPALAADFGLVHGATVALFYSFSGNARSLILAESGMVGAATILRLRLFLVLPLGALAWALCFGVVGGGGLFVLLLVLRRACEWLAEVLLSQQELRQQAAATLGLLVVQGGLSLALLLVLLFSDPWILPTLALWSLSPLLACFKLDLRLSDRAAIAGLWPALRQLLPHFGSTMAIGVSVYVFRLFILLVAGKEVAGDLFSAFALGGIVGAIFAQALGPTLVREERRGSGASTLLRLFRLVMVGVMIGGALLVVGLWAYPGLMDWTHKSVLFWLAVGCSLIGSVVMVMAQRIRLRMLQDEHGGDVFGSDMLANILLVACIPGLYYGVGPPALVGLYLLGALLSLVFYASERHGLRVWTGAGRCGERSLLQLIAVAIFLPLFFQLQGGLFDDPSMTFNSGGVLAVLPLPLSIAACYLGIMLLGRYSRVRLALWCLFFVFIGMLLTSLLLGLDNTGEGRQKLVLLIQYLLPMFALVLGQQVGERDPGLEAAGRAAFMVLLIVLPLQLLATALSGEAVLSPSTGLFSIYQHLHYVPVLMVGAFVLALFTLWQRPGFSGWLSLLAGLMGAYVVLSWSRLAMLLYGLGMMLFVVRQLGRSRWWWLPGQAALGAILAVVYAALVAPAGRFGGLLKFGSAYPESWLFYLHGIISGWASAMLGHGGSPHRELHPSALNYYLDFLYNFGLVGLLPLILLALYSFVLVWRQRRAIWAIPAHTGLVLVVVFLLTLDNGFKVGLRQPYPGVIMFFLWGVLLAVVSSPGMRCSSPAGSESRAACAGIP